MFVTRCPASVMKSMIESIREEHIQECNSLREDTIQKITEYNRTFFFIPISKISRDRAEFLYDCGYDLRNYGIYHVRKTQRFHMNTITKCDEIISNCNIAYGLANYSIKDGEASIDPIVDFDINSLLLVPEY